MIRSSVIIFALAGLVGITLAALGMRFFISFFSGMSVMIFGILIEFIVLSRKRKKVVQSSKNLNPWSFRL